MDEKEMQQKALEWQLMEASMNSLKEQQQVLVGRYEELQATRATIEELERTQAGRSLIPIGAGNFVHGSIESSKDIIVGIGGGIAVKKTRKGAMETIEARSREMEKIMEDIAKQEHEIIQKMQKMQAELQRAEKK